MANCCCCRAAAIVAAIVLPGGKAGRLIVPLSFEAAEPIHCLQNYRSYWDIKTSGYYTEIHKCKNVILSWNESWRTIPGLEFKFVMILGGFGGGGGGGNESWLPIKDLLCK